MKVMLLPGMDGGKPQSENAEQAAENSARAAARVAAARLRGAVCAGRLLRARELRAGRVSLRRGLPIGRLLSPHMHRWQRPQVAPSAPDERAPGRAEWLTTAVTPLSARVDAACIASVRLRRRSALPPRRAHVQPDALCGPCHQAAAAAGSASRARATASRDGREPTAPSHSRSVPPTAPSPSRGAGRCLGRLST